MSNPIQNKLEIPLWATSRKFRPIEYGKLVDEVKRSDGLMCTEKVCTLLMKTGLRREFLGYIWSTANRHTPGVLNEQEFCIILALVALAQKGNPTFDLNLLSHLHEPPIPIFDKKFTLKQDNIRLQNFGLNPQFTSCSSFNNSTMIDGKSSEDEYSDFQCAPVPSSISNSNVQAGNVNSRSLFSKSMGTSAFHSASISVSQPAFDSPVHAIANFPKQNSQLNSGQVAKSVSESSVGSRLANYDLGMSSSATTVNQLPGVTPNENLLIGEVDKYSALRDLVTTEPLPMESNEIVNGKEDSSVSQYKRNNSIQKDSSVVSDDILQVVKTEPVDVSSDFGDFQSFSNTTIGNTLESFENLQLRNPVDVFSDSLAVWNQHGISSIETSSPQLPNISSSLYISNNMSNLKRNNFSDGEFGEFVSCTDSVFSTDVPDLSVQTRTTNIDFANSKIDALFKSKMQANQTAPKLSLNISAKMDSSVQKKSGSDRISSKTNTFHTSKSSQKSPKVDSSSNSDLNFNANDDIGFPNDSDFDISDIKFEMIGSLKSACSGSDDFFVNDSVGYQINLEAINTQDFDCVHPIKSKFSETSPETRSLASLDFGNYNTTWDLSDTTKPSVEATVGLNLESKIFKGDMNYPVSSPSSPSLNSKYFNNNNTGASITSQQSVDKYQCFKEEIENETERYSYEWIRCMQCCLQIISYAMNIFNSASSSAVIRDVVCNEKGQTYILNLIEVCLVASRIQRSWLKLGGDSKVGQIHHEIVEAWDSLTPFLLGTPLMEDISSADEWLEGEYSDYSKVCGVCLINTKKDDPNALLDYGGKHYHATCANLWINGVDSILPSLSYVSLL